MEEIKPQNIEGQDAGKTSWKTKKIRILLAILCLLIIGLGTVGWLYYDSAKTVNDQKDQIAKLRDQIKDLGLKPVVDLPLDTDDSDEAATCMGGAAYSADIGNFEVSVSDPNVIIRALDGNFEGGPVTNLAIGRCLAGQVNVVDTYPTNEVKILGHPSSSSAELRAAFESNWGSPLTPGPSVTVDGVAAQTYTGVGLFTTKLVYFDHAGIGYQIELTDSNPTSEAILTDVISDWSFTP